MNCPYCNGHPKIVSGEIIYPHRPDLYTKWFWRCAPCDAYVGCHPTGSGKSPLGRLANKELRLAKSAAHASFDQIWRSGRMSRPDAYAWLAKAMGLPKDEAHIGMFNEQQCAQVVLLVAEYLP